MRALACTVTAWPAARASWREHVPQLEIVQLDPADCGAYWREISARWGTGDLLLIEQDIIVHGQVVPQFEGCPEPWCLFPYALRAHLPASFSSGLGCTRFRRAFTETVTAADVQPVPGGCGLCPGKEVAACWQYLDRKIMAAALARGFTGPHVHQPPVGHRDF